MPTYVEQEFNKLDKHLNQDVWSVPIQYVAPAKPRTGMIALADGTRWNPGSGAGFYGYYGGAWHFLG